jgi:hypothetical protein
MNIPSSVELVIDSLGNLISPNYLQLAVCAYVMKLGGWVKISYKPD